MECQSLRESGKAIAKFDVAFFGASCDRFEKNKKFADKLELNFPLLSDPEKKVAKSYGILRGSFSKRVTIYVNKDGKIAHIENKIDIRNAGKQVVAKLEELAAVKK